MTTSFPYSIDILRHVDRTHGVDYWVWSLLSQFGRNEGGRVDALAGEYGLGGSNPTGEAERVCRQVCRQFDIARCDVELAVC